jgi:hypothetical protein
MAHEVNHNLGNHNWGRHAGGDCGGAGPDPNYDRTDRDDVGWDPDNGIYPVDHPSKDIKSEVMSYCVDGGGPWPQRWTSKYRWRLLVDRLRADNWDGNPVHPDDRGAF